MHPPALWDHSKPDIFYLEFKEKPLFSAKKKNEVNGWI